MSWRITLLLAAVGVTMAATAEPATVSGEGVEPRPPGPRDRCSVCGMFVAPHADWAAQVVFEDGPRAFFDGAKDLFTYLLSRDRYLPEVRQLDIVAVYVTDYYEVTPIPAREAFFVVGSDVLGPMGHELVPHADREAADEFLRDHGGRQIVTFDEVTRALLQSLR